MTIQPFTLAWTYSKQEYDPVAGESGLSSLAPKGDAFVKQLRASLKSQTLYSRGAMLTSLSLLAACGSSGGGGGVTPMPTPTPPPANNAPVAGADDTLTVLEDAADTALGIAAPTDADAGDTLTITIDVLPTEGDIISGGAVVTTTTTLSAADIGNLQYRPDPDANGAAGVFTYTVSDGTDTDSQTVTIDVTAVNDDPDVGADATVTIAEDTVTATALNLTAPTDEEGETLTITVTGTPTGGIVTLAGGGALPMNGVITALQYESLEFTPTADFSGDAGDLVITVTDPSGGMSTQTIGFSVTASQDAPTVDGDANGGATAGVPLELNITTPTDADGEMLTITVTNLPTIGEIQLADGTTVTTGPLDIADIAGLRFVTMDGDSGAAGTFTYTVSDGTDTVDSTITLSVASGTFSLDGGLDGSNGFTVESTFFNNIGAVVASGGDINGDGIDDILIGTRSNVAFVVYGDAVTASTIDTTTDVTFGGTLLGEIFAGEAGSTFGASIAIVGDLNGDGENDFVIGAPTSDDGGAVDTGIAYVVFDPADGSLPNSISAPANVPDDTGQLDLIVAGRLANMSGIDGFTIVSENADARGGFAVASIGDVNGDGRADLAFGAPQEDIGGTDRGQVSLIFGNDSMTTFGPTVSSDPGTTFNPADDVLTGPSDGALIGAEIAGLGDINGDGVDDFVLGAPSSNTAAGEAIIVFGIDDESADFNSDLSLYGTAGNEALGIRIQGAAGDQVGSSIIGGGDFNDDGIDDIIIGAKGDNADAGSVIVLFGKASGDSYDFGNNFVLGTDTLASDDGFIISGPPMSGGLIGSELTVLEDFNGDGINDFALTAEGGDGGNGDVVLVFGSSTIGDQPIDFLSPDAGSFLVITGGPSGINLGRSLASGDVGGSGNSDLIIGTDDSAYVIYGFDVGDTGLSPASESILSLDGGIVLPDGDDGDAGDLPPMDTAGADAGTAGTGPSSDGAGTAGAGADMMMPDDIDLSGVA